MVSVAAPPLFSILLPSRNRVTLLRRAIQSVLDQDCGDFEIIVADNASEEDYAGAVQAFDDHRIRLVRAAKPLAVHENWRLALSFARGRLIMMLGDDDALLRDALSRVRAVAQAENAPDLIYAMACHYAYPGVVPDNPDGFFLAVRNAAVFDAGEAPYPLAPGCAAALARKAFRFRHHISFNAQHFVWSQALVARMTAAGGLFGEPYPDYFAAVASFLMARRIVVMPEPVAVIGVADRSFGAYFVSGREDAGFDMLRLSAEPDPALELEDASDAAQAREALAIGGSRHYRNWLLSLMRLRAAHHVCAEMAIDWRAYRRIQLIHLAAAAAGDSARRAAFLRNVVRGLAPSEAAFARTVLRHNLWDRRMGRFDPQRATGQQIVALGVYYPATTAPAATGAYPDILAAVAAYQPPSPRTDPSRRA